MSNGDLGDSIPDEYVAETDETEGEWKGCTRKFLSPISVNSRGSGEICNASIIVLGYLSLIIYSFVRYHSLDRNSKQSTIQQVHRFQGRRA